MRVGLGYDAHRLVAGRPLILGGVEIPHAQGLLGHSDADVLATPSATPSWARWGPATWGPISRIRTRPTKDISSLILLERIMQSSGTGVSSR